MGHQLLYIVFYFLSVKYFRFLFLIIYLLSDFYFDGRVCGVRGGGWGGGGGGMWKTDYMHELKKIFKCTTQAIYNPSTPIKMLSEIGSR